MPRVVHFEIHASDPERLVRFYGDLFAWSFQPWGPPDTYWLIRTGSAEQPGIDGGLVRRRGPAPTPALAENLAVNAYVCTVDVPSAAAALARVAELGGTVALPTTAIPGVGWLAYGKDPDGNILGLMQADSTAA